MLTVEDGRNRDFANTYADLACADAYLVPRGLWPATAVEVDTEAGTETPDAMMIQAKERALIRAFDWLNSLDWLGEPLDWEQQAAWPRSGVPVPGHIKDKRHWPYRLTDLLFWREPNHCFESYQSEVNDRQLRPECRP